MAFALERLVACGRPLSALRACHGKFSPYEPELIFRMLEGMLRGEEIETGIPESYYIQRALEFVEKNSDQIDHQRLVGLEFALVRLLGFQGEHHAKTLYHAIMSQPELFVELLCILYRPSNGEPREPDEGLKVAAHNAWQVLHHCKRQPGTDSDDSIDPAKFSAFVAEARRLATEQDRLVVCDIRLGEIMAYAPEGADGIWPFDPVRDALETTDSVELHRGFSTGCFNKRGVHSRGMFDGGEQERGLAAYYRRQADALEASHPKLAATLAGLARSYDKDGLVEDLEARLRREGH
ncbi:MAG: hypothetical protein QOD42_3356 [Sphingomonadales bacterium]|jgi:hypothetical protein|nr:hypothetical protein [Sphingomonadales bacterium]